MKAVRITRLDGPDAVEVDEIPEPTAEAVNELFPDVEAGVLIAVHAAGVAFPDLLQSRGEYQVQPDLPFTPGSEVAGRVISAPASSGFEEGDRVAGLCVLGGLAEVAVAPAYLTFPLPDRMGFDEGASLIMNYHTAYFSLVDRGRLRAGETVLVNGAAGGVGSAVVQLVAALGGRAIAAVSSEAKAAVARDAGAAEVVRTDGEWKEEVKALTGGRGVDLVIDVVGGDLFLDGLRSLRSEGRLVVVGFASGDIPNVKVNRLLLRNLEVIGANWGEDSDHLRRLAPVIGERLGELMNEDKLRPLVGRRHQLGEIGRALQELDSRRAIGKVVVQVSNDLTGIPA